METLWLLLLRVKFKFSHPEYPLYFTPLKAGLLLVDKKQAYIRVSDTVGDQVLWKCPLHLLMTDLAEMIWVFLGEGCLQPPQWCFHSALSLHNCLVHMGSWPVNSLHKVGHPSL